jgi:hypothetical protein
MMREDEANALAGRIMRKFDIAYPSVFKDEPILHEDSGVAVNNAGTGAAIAGVGDNTSDPSKPLAQFLFKGGKNMLRDPLLNNKKKLKDIIKRK